MSRKTNIININGKRYDAVTGAVIDHVSSGSPALARSLDGVVSHATPSPQTVVQPPKPEPVQVQPIVKKPVMDIARGAVPQQLNRKPQPAQTLMRSAVSKPDPTLSKLRSKTVANAAAPSVAAPPLTTKFSLQQVDKKRELRATQSTKSELVNRFGALKPAQPGTIIAAPTNRPITSDPERPVVTVPPVIAPEPERPATDIFERALQAADAHEQPSVEPQKKRGHASARLKAITATSLIVVVLGGVLAYQNMNNINFYVTSSKAGFQAAMPGYHPSGFGIDKLTASTGIFTAKYKSNSDGRNFTLTEKPSSWDSVTLRDVFVVNVAKSYQTIQSAGQTVYIYGNNNATWVSGGVWYQLQSQGSLSDEQLIEIASSV